MSAEDEAPVSPAELRKRVRAAEALQAKTRELAAADVLVKRDAAKKAAQVKETADREAREAVAAALRLFDDPGLVSSLLSIPMDDLEKDAKPVTAARAKEVIEALRTRAERPRTRRRRAPRQEAPSQPTAAASAPAPAGTPDNVPVHAL
ncbi:hypothetical protein [Streptomyces monomycini]|uniref:hypothetical protein n=1 Tax=Streptomyces monomycini TaxID=371720 RepID=UPI0004AA97D4|nr:hypothetical protein [Streptomyces monomycini]